MKLEYQTDQRGNQSIADKDFKNTVFMHMTIAPYHGRTIELRNVRFENCTTSPGTCVITDGVKLTNVVFSNFDCGDALRIASEAQINQVQIIGENPSSFIVQPLNSDTYAIRESICDYAIDISRFSGRVNIYGFRGAAIRHNPSRHVVISTEHIDNVDWKALGIGITSFWRIILEKLQKFNATEGVFSLPDNVRESSFMEERLKLAGLGICKE